MSTAAAIALRSAPALGAGRAGWPDVVAVAVRPQFRVDLLLVGPDDPVLFGAPCAASACPWPQRGGHGLCPGHAKQFRARAGGLDVTAWLALATQDGGPRPLRGLRSLEGCQVGGWCPLGLGWSAVSLS